MEGRLDGAEDVEGSKLGCKLGSGEALGAVGLPLGVFDVEGDWLGTRLGINESEGTRLGFPDGSKVSLGISETEGTNDGRGLSLGTLETEGSRDGPAEKLGSPEGDPLGSILGLSDG